ncbi:MAG TPA: response regulator [Candidatus Omnitrophota bacterium]|nr:response regulator [Candidatus Omnitrophota bacterium]HPS19760.1 response regulator [Candidatus Omnitrophota bacterium]
MAGKQVKETIRVLILEDNDVDSRLLSNTLLESSQYEYTIKVTETLKAALEVLASERFDIVLLDLNLSDSKGTDTVMRISQAKPDLPIIVITGEYDESKGIDALNKGAQEYLIKGGFSGKMLDKVIRYSVERKKTEKVLLEEQRIFSTVVGNLPGMAYRAYNDTRRTMEFISGGSFGLTGYDPEHLMNNTKMAYRDIIKKEDRDLVWYSIQNGVSEHKIYKMGYRISAADGREKWVWEQGQGVFTPDGKLLFLEGFIMDISDRKRTENELEHTISALAKTFEDMVHALALTVEMRDPYTAGHQKRVAQLSYALAKELDLGTETAQGVYLAGLVHDVGKIYIPVEILGSPRKLNDVEFSIIKTHSKVGFDILKNIKSPWPIAEVALQHHERINGSGYPEGICGDTILTESKIVSVADVVEAMASHRPYRAALGVDMALAEIRRNSGTCFDPKIVDACEVLFRKKSFDFSDPIS